MSLKVNRILRVELEHCCAEKGYKFPKASIEIKDIGDDCFRMSIGSIENEVDGKSLREFSERLNELVNVEGVK